MRNRAGFTLIELAISVFILLLLLALAVPSMSGVLADRRLHRSFDEFNRLTTQAQKLSAEQRRPYLIVWQRGKITLQPESFAKDEKKEPTAVLSVNKDEVFGLTLPAALVKKTESEWIFWPSGNCEPAIVDFKGRDGIWKAEYSALTGRGELKRYVPR
jgi:prepilin-type N-terminal cleavage/methylation domain-containing protein